MAIYFSFYFLLYYFTFFELKHKVALKADLDPSNPLSGGMSALIRSDQKHYQMLIGQPFLLTKNIV